MQDKRAQTQSIEPSLERSLSHPRRLEIFGYLMQQGRGVGETKLVEALGLPAPTVGYHLAVLCDAALIVQVETPNGESERTFTTAASAGQ